jgi:hypothetical protein
MSELYREYIELKSRYDWLKKQEGGNCGCKKQTTITHISPIDPPAEETSTSHVSDIINIYTTGLNDAGGSFNSDFKDYQKLITAWRGGNDQTGKDFPSMYSIIREAIPDKYKLNIVHFDMFGDAVTEADFGEIRDGDTQRLEKRFINMNDLAKLCTKDGEIASLDDPLNRKPHLLCDFAHIVEYKDGMKIAPEFDEEGKEYENISCMYLGYDTVFYVLGMLCKQNSAIGKIYSMVRFNEDTNMIENICQKLMDTRLENVDDMSDVPKNDPKQFSVEFWSNKYQDGKYVHLPKIKLLNNEIVNNVSSLLIVFMVADMINFECDIAKKIRGILSTSNIGAFKFPKKDKLNTKMGISDIDNYAGKFYTDLRDVDQPIKTVLSFNGKYISSSGSLFIIKPINIKERPYLHLVILAKKSNPS